ncbi:hypothetical protein L1887_31878 [Cichorium endivia]|nr:hypothetical protein L1887_31878 [Cichorium endivia]
MLNDEIFHSGKGNSGINQNEKYYKRCSDDSDIQEIHEIEENDKDCTDNLDIQDERFNEENDNSEVHQNEENDKSCLIELDIQSESDNVGGESQSSNNLIGLNGSLVWISEIDRKMIPDRNTICNDLNDGRDCQILQK